MLRFEPDRTRVNCGRPGIQEQPCTSLTETDRRDSRERPEPAARCCWTG
ncbi:MAG: hypothetical protein FJ245_06980 [Nitrospira sp.]|nr:hypothetical protein [Nitrospira sp.]